MKKSLIKIPIYAVLVILFFINLVALGFHAASIVLTAVVTFHFDMQVVLFLILLSVLILSFVWVFFIKMQTKIKVPLLLILVIVQIIYFKCSCYIPTVGKHINIESCIDAGHIWDEANDKCINY